MTTQNAMERTTIWWPILSVLTIMAGLLAIVAPMAAGLTTTLIAGWFISFAGATHLWLAFEPQRFDARLWHVLSALIYGVGGFYLIARPDIGLVSLTLFLSAMLVAGGMFRMVAFFGLRERTGAIWLLADGILTILLGAMIYLGWPESSHWAVGTLVGATILLNGIANLIFSLTVRRMVARHFHRDEPGHVFLTGTHDQLNN